jgi:hypothetical protein
MQIWIHEAQIQNMPYRGYWRKASQYRAVKPNGQGQRTFYSPILAWIGRSLIGFGLQLHRKHGTRQIVVAARPRTA